MRHATKPQCEKSQACLIGAGGVRGVTESYAGYGVCALRARREVAERPTEAEGKYPFSLDSKEPKWELFQDYLKGEVRFASVAKQFPNEAAELFAAAQENAQWRYKSYLRMLGTAW